MSKLVNKKNITILSIIVISLFTVIITGTYAYQQLAINNANATGQGGCFNVNYTGQNLTSANITSTTIFSEGAQATVTLSKNTSCKIYTEANIYLKTNNSTTAPIESVPALKYKVYSGSSQISEGIITNKNDYLLATVPLTDSSTTYTVYIWIDSNMSAGYFTNKTYTGYIYASSSQTSTIEGNYLVNFDTNNGDNLSLSKTVSKGQSYGWLPTPKKEGYNFDGWGYGIPVSGKTDKAWVTPFVDNNFIVSNLQPNTEYKVDYDIVLNESIPSGYTASQTSQWGNLGFRTGTSSYSYTMVSGGNLYNKSGANYTVGQTYHISGTYTTPSDLSSAIMVFYTARSQNSGGSGYVINGTIKNIVFYDLSSSYGQVNSETIVSQSNNHTLKAIWSANSSIVKFNANGGTVSTTSKQVTYGSTYGTLPTPTKSGKSFKGWTIAPVGYDEVEYVQSTGTQYITTNIIPTNSMGVYAKVVSTSITSDLLYFGSKGSNNSRFWIGNTNSKVYFGWNTVTYAGSTTTTSATNIIKMNYLNNRQSIYNTSVVTSSLGSLATNSYPIAIFAGNNAGTISNKSSIKLYELKISNGPTIINNFIPCYEENSGKYGLCDMVNIKFYPNAATSGNDFGHGANVYINSSSTVNTAKDHTLSAVWE